MSNQTKLFIHHKTILPRPFIESNKDYVVKILPEEAKTIIKHKVNKTHVNCKGDNCKYCEKDTPKIYYYRITVKDTTSGIEYWWDLCETNYSMFINHYEDNNYSLEEDYHIIFSKSSNRITIENSSFKQPKTVEAVENTIKKPNPFKKQPNPFADIKKASPVAQKQLETDKEDEDGLDKFIEEITPQTEKIDQELMSSCEKLLRADYEEKKKPLPASSIFRKQCENMYEESKRLMELKDEN